ncbi:putative small s protein [Phaeoacremonium minimum UCRPA7]|uniref:Putative small s protein n=1 Tax=Phaeoacremonium minimum (strain UCR-PA7) TaxID=1286976 RepID=R8BED2_PHAM7|nr:putative small s protein [Phaeoacremonium minimum UCRPA7]EON97640.1 putative small s protein [Phaeoacremonium minimum UCRPA7]
MCLSSRRWPVFERTFGGDGQESLDIHELTRNDIRKFVNGQLQSHSRWTTEVPEQVTLEKAELVDRIVAQADGVFLWAFFVTRSLGEGLSNDESIGDLKIRFGQLPSDLDQLFQHMLESVNLADHPKMAGILQAAVHALEPLHVDLYWHLEKDLDGYDSKSHGLMKSAPENIAARREQTVRSINQKTKGLLSIVHERAEFLHRTVKDFFLTKDMGEYLRSKLPADYNGFASIAAAYLSFLRTTRQDHPLVAGVIRQGRGLNTGPFISHLNQALVYTSEALKQTDQAGSHQHRQVEKLLDQYEAAIVTMVNVGQVSISGVNFRDCDPRLVFREELLRHDLAPYLVKKIREQPEFFAVFDESPLFAALMPMSRNSGDSPPPASEILDLLLQRGEDPNVRPRQPGAGPASDDTASPWVLFARSTMSVFNMLSGPCMFPALRWNECLKQATFNRLMAHGADPNAKLLDRWGAHTVFSHFLDISLSKFLGEECFEDYLGTLDAFLRVGASLGVPDPAGAAGAGAETAFGNLARRRPEEPVLTSFCTELKGLLARFAADPKRAMFISSVLKKLIVHCSGREEALRELDSAISQGCPADIAAPLSQLISSEIEDRREQESTRKRLPNGDWDSGSSGSKHLRRA